MKIQCDHCETRYRLPDEKAPDAKKVYKIRCKVCGSMMVFRGLGDDGEPAPGITGVDQEPLWYTADGSGGREGPFTEDQLMKKYVRGEIHEDGYVWRQGFDDWQVFSEADELKHLLETATEVVNAPEMSKLEELEDAGDVAPDEAETVLGMPTMTEAEYAALAAAAQDKKQPEFAPPAAGGTDPVEEDTIATTAMEALKLPDGDSAPSKDTRVMSEDELALDHETLDKAVTQEIKPGELSLEPGQESPTEKMEYYEPESSLEISSETDLATHRENLERERERTDKLRMKYQRRDTSVLFSLSDLTAPSQTEAQKREQAAVPLDIREVAQEMRATRESDDPFRRFDRATDRSTRPDVSLQPSPVTISIPVVKRRKGRQLVYPILSAILTAGVTVGVMLYFNNQKAAQVAPPPTTASQSEAVGASPNKPAEPSKAQGAKALAASAQADAKGSETTDLGRTIAIAPKAPVAPEEGQQAAPVEKVADTTAEKPKTVAAKPKPAARPKKRKTSSSTTKSASAKASKPKPKVEKTPPPAPVAKKKAGGDDINALLSGIRNERGKSSSADANLPDKPSMGQIKGVVKRYQGKINNCNKSGGGEAVRVMTKVDIRGADGSVTQARVLTPPFSTNAVGTCIQGVFKQMNFGKFRRPSFTFRYPIFLQ